MDAHTPPQASHDILDCLVVGAGFSGLNVAIALQRSGRRYLVLEQAHDLGGTWRDNQYPGAACDVPSHLYSLSQVPNPLWSRLYAPQAEIYQYMHYCVDTQGIRSALRFGVSVAEARWHSDKNCWAVASTDGKVFYATSLVIATGALSRPRMPGIEGLDQFKGPVIHSARWPKDYSLAGKRVGVIGTGASAIQIVPVIAGEVQSLTLFQRTPAWILPRGDRAITEATQQRYQYHPQQMRRHRWRLYWGHEWRAFAFTRAPGLLAQAEKQALKHMQRQVPDAALRQRLVPSYRIGCKRILLSDDFYPALSLPQVQLVDQAVVRASANGLVSADGREHALDVVIAATGFQVNDVQTPFEVYGRGSQSLNHVWKDSGPQAYLGTVVHGFPNMFLMTGPNTGLGHNSMLYVIEAQTAFVMSALLTLEKTRAVAAFDVKAEVQQHYNQRLQQRMQRTVWNTGGCKSWYLSADGKNRTLWPDFTFKLRRKLAQFDWRAFEAIET